jgi:hypothetical protein
LIDVAGDFSLAWGLAVVGGVDLSLSLALWGIKFKLFYLVKIDFISLKGMLPDVPGISSTIF